ncbi:flagellar filament capping protein FliD [uncultured Paludibaculum sp.]|uniref:flagellar filament capping protein FliD n=1 Tax=uncultured Paludibaculum sp. TaxID=1765020 RepID=UPI002AAB7A9A|nr:flagellar filament capping protein FliD [uncultured Paludibaculum sp.]
MSTIFNGNSRYAADFQTIIDRTVAIASMPLSQLNTQKTGLTDESTALQSLDTKFQALQTALSTLDDAMGSGAIGATLTDTSTVTASISSGALEGTYTIEVLDQGAYTTTLTSDAGPRPVDYPASQSLSKLAAPAFTLTVGSNDYQLSPATNTLQGLVDAINAEPGANVQASVVNAGTASTPDYRLSIVSTEPGDVAIQLNDGSMDLLTEQAHGDAEGGVTSAQSSLPGPNVVTNPDAQSLSNLVSPHFSLTVGSSTFTVSPAKNTLSGLVEAINANSLNGVRATVVNVGSNTAPDYRLSLKASKLGDFAVTLTDGAIQLQAEQVRGQLASYKVNGSSNLAQSDSRSVTIAPGLSVNLIGVSKAGSPTSITLTRESSAVSNALAALVNSYNAAVDEVDKHHGTAGGALSGQGVIRNLSSALQKITGHLESGTGVNSLVAMGISLDQTGHMAFNEMSFLAANFADAAGVTNFLGSASTKGFLQAATSVINEVEDTVTGTLKSAMNAVDGQTKALDSQIADKQSYIDQMRSDLEQRMAAADALVATLEQQYNYISQVLDSMNSVTSTYE